jgi:hypothetical protein
MQDVHHLPLTIAVDAFGHPGLLLICHYQCHPPCRVILAAPPHRSSTFAVQAILFQSGRFDPSWGPAILARPDNLQEGMCGNV